MSITKLRTLLTGTLADFWSYFFAVHGSTRYIRLGIAGAVIVGGVVSSALLTNEPVTSVDTERLQTVTLRSADEVSASDSVSYIGTVAALQEANLRSEVGGRVVSVPVSLGDRVSPGTTIAILENAAERAAVLQAEGAYESALASAAQSDVSVESARVGLTDAEKTALSTYQSAYATTNTVVLNTVDIFFSDPNFSTPGLRIDGPARELNDMRVALQTELPQWQVNTRTIQGAQIDSALDEASETIEHVISMLDLLAEAIPKERRDATINDTLVRSYLDDVTSARSTLTSTLRSIRSAESTLSQAREALRTAEIGGTTGEISAANAQVKQAAGSLAAARARLADTIITSPIAGTVATLDVRTGDYIQAFTDIGRISSTDGFEITLKVGREDRERFAVGDIVEIGTDITGTVSEVASGIDRTSGTVTVRIVTNGDLRSGDTVTVRTTVGDSAPKEIIVPVTALKFSSGDTYVLGVEDGITTEIPVTIGTISADSVTIADGLTQTTEFIIDARGIAVGERVAVASE